MSESASSGERNLALTRDQVGALLDGRVNHEALGVLVEGQYTKTLLAISAIVEMTPERWVSEAMSLLAEAQVVIAQPFMQRCAIQ